MDNDLGSFSARFGLETNSHPAVALLPVFITARGYCIREDKEFGCVPSFRAEPFPLQLVFIIEHHLEPLPADVALAGAVNRVAHDHVISRHRFGNGPGRAAHAKKPARHFLSRADFGESPVFARVEIDLEGFLMRVEFGSFHPGEGYNRFSDMRVEKNWIRLVSFGVEENREEPDHAVHSRIYPRGRKQLTNGDRQGEVAAGRAKPSGTNHYQRAKTEHACSCDSEGCYSRFGSAQRDLYRLQTKHLRRR